MMIITKYLRVCIIMVLMKHYQTFLLPKREEEKKTCYENAKLVYFFLDVLPR